jgi:MoaA/NifB/PqqE/SkfB family radical SAM enzyme
LINKVSSKLEELGKKGFPSSAYFEVTYRCNANCQYCFLGKLRHSTTDLDTKSIKNIIDKLATSGIIFLAITGGEPFVRNDILQILDHVKMAGFFSAGIMTNGICLTKDHLSYLASHRSEFGFGVSLTVFSHDPSINDLYFGIKGSLKTIIENATFLKDHGIPILIKIPIFSDTVKSARESINFFKNKGFTVNSFVQKTVTPENQDFLKESITDDFMREYFSIIEGKKRERVKVRDQNKSSPGNNYSTCSGRLTAITVGPRGGLRPCILMEPQYSDVNLIDYANLKLAIQASPLCTNIRKLTERDFPKCKKCPDSADCVICPGSNFNYSGRFDLPSTHHCRSQTIQRKGVLKS